jgi:hypothetical protein
MYGTRSYPPRALVAFLCRERMVVSLDSGCSWCASWGFGVRLHPMRPLGRMKSDGGTKRSSGRWPTVVPHSLGTTPRSARMDSTKDGIGAS